MTTHHIQNCRASWRRHQKKCPMCKGREPWEFCIPGTLAYGEWIASITANPQCENLVATDTKEAQGCVTLKT